MSKVSFALYCLLAILCLFAILTVAQGTEPTDPEPTDPEPTDPEPTDPEPTDPEPTDPVEPHWICSVTIPPATETDEPTTEDKPCNEVFAAKCPTEAEITAAAPKCSDETADACAAVTAPAVCTFAWVCKPTAEGDVTTCGDDVRTNWSEVVDGTTITFSRVVTCTGTNYLAETVVSEDASCTETKPEVTFDATRDLVVECLEYEKGPAEIVGGPLIDVYSACPTVALFTDAEQVKFCDGHKQTVTQKCHYNITRKAADEEEVPPPEPEEGDGSEPAPMKVQEDTDVPVSDVVWTEDVECTPTDLVPLVCPVYAPKCTDKYYVEPEDDGEEEAPTTGDEETPTTGDDVDVTNTGEEPTQDDGVEEPTVEEIHEIDAATCRTYKPTCATCTKQVIPLVTSFANPEPALAVRCYRLVPAVTPPTPPEDDNDDDADEGEVVPFNLQHDHEDDGEYEYVADLTPQQYQLCLRGGSFTVDPATVQPEPACPSIATCPYSKCKGVDDAFTFENCYDNAAECKKTQNFPCTGELNVTSECFIGDDKQTATTGCAAITEYEPPQLTGACEPTNCPSFTWKSSFVNVDEESSSFGEEETTSGMIIITPTASITVSLNNIDDLAVNNWGCTVYKRVSVPTQDGPSTVTYTPVHNVHGITTPSATIPVTWYEFSAPMSQHYDVNYVLRATYDKYTLIHEGDSGDCEELDIENVIPANPTCPPEEDTEDDTKDEEVTPSQFKAQWFIWDDGASQECPSQLLSTPGREKTAILTTECAAAVGGHCENGSTCEATTVEVDGKEEKQYQCSACINGFQGSRCNKCDLTDMCKNGSTPQEYKPNNSCSANTNTDPVAHAFAQKVYALVNAANEEPIDDATEEETSPEEEISSIDNSADGQCRCACAGKDFAGLYCQCKAFYARITFKEGQEGNKADLTQLLTSYVTQLADIAGISMTTIQPYEYGTELKKKNKGDINKPKDTRAFIVVQFSACTLPQTDAFFSLATEVSYTPEEVANGWDKLLLSNEKEIEADQLGGVYAISSLYDPTCVGQDCTTDVTSPSYEVPKEDIVSDYGSSVWWIAIIVILVIILIIALVALVKHIKKSNQKKQFGARSDEHLDMAEIS